MRKSPKPVTRQEEERIVRLRDCKDHHSFACIGNQVGRHSATVHKIYMRATACTRDHSRQKVGTVHTTTAKSSPRSPSPVSPGEATEIYNLRERHNMSWGKIAETMNRSSSVCRRSYERTVALKGARVMGQIAASAPAYIPDSKPGLFRRFHRWVFS